MWTRSSLFLIDMIIHMESFNLQFWSVYLCFGFNFLCSSRFDWQDQFLFLENSFSGKLASLWLLEDICKPRYWNISIGIWIRIGIGTDTTNSSSIRTMDTKPSSWWFRMRGPHPQSHVTLQYRGHVTNKKRYISPFTRPIDPKLNRVVTLDEGTSPIKSRDTAMWSRDRSKTLYLYFHKAYGPKLANWWFSMRRRYPQSHMTLQYCGHVTNKNIIFWLSQGLWTPNLAGWKLRIRGLT